ncbi:MAG: hypothetical protein U9R02_00460 [Thermodesulfobacteriota bacterium]|nr:hypothetical protein [Thermodesulfobacteriota bacterium]
MALNVVSNAGPLMGFSKLIAPALSKNVLLLMDAERGRNYARQKNLHCFSFRLFGKGGFMSALSQVEKISQKYSVSAEEFIRSGVIANLREKQRLLQIERFEILARYQASNVEELNHKIAEGSEPEHPAWEDLIEVKNIEQEINEIENDIGAL